MMRIDLFLNNNEETHIASFFDVACNPFKKGDVINLSVSSITPRVLNSVRSELAEKLIEENKKKKEIFNMEEIKLVEENKYIDLETNKIIIEYFCELIR